MFAAYYEAIAHLVVPHGALLAGYVSVYILREYLVSDRIPEYPHWKMQPQLKTYYLMQASYWCQQLIVLLLGLEKPRKDYNELVAHHFVTLWMVGCVTLPCAS